MRTLFPESLLAGIVIALCACSPQAAEQVPEPTSAAAAATHPVSGLAIIPVTITTADGPHVIEAEVADNPLAQQRGLMFRTEMGADEGMIFPYAQPQYLGFWMRNTVLSLDLIFIGPDHTVINIADHAEPYSEESLASDAPAIAVLELNAGRAEELGIVPGTRIDW